MDIKGDGKFISLDMREHLYPLIARRMDRMGDAFAVRQWEACFLEAEVIKMTISSEMKEEVKNLFDNASEKITGLINKANVKVVTGEDKTSKETALSKLPLFVRIYIELIYKEMNAQNIWFPKSVRHDSFDTAFMQETFGIDPSELQSKRDELLKLSSEELVNLLSKGDVENVFAKLVIRDVLQE
jgi:hypothetical protein